MNLVRACLIALCLCVSAVKAERVDVLPQDANKLYLTVYGNCDEPRYQTLCHWFATKLSDIRDRFHYRIIETHTPLFHDRYSKFVPTTPCLQVMDGESKVLELSGRDLPHDAGQLRNVLQRVCPLRRPDPQPINPQPMNPQPQVIHPQPQIIVVPTPSVPVEPAKPSEPEFPTGLLITLVAIAAVIGIGGGVAVGWKQSIS